MIISVILIDRSCAGVVSLIRSVASDLGCGIRRRSTAESQRRRYKRRVVVKLIGGGTECPLQVCQLGRSSESTHFRSFVDM